MLLAIETATDVCSVVFKNKDGASFEKRSETKGSHSENMFLFIQELMKKYSFRIDDLNAVLVSEGPGSYTGLRIAASGVKGFLFGHNVPLYGVNTLASFAMAAINKHVGSLKIHSIIDARRKHLYHQSFSFQDDCLTADNEPEIRSIKKIQRLIQPNDVVIGTGLSRLDELQLEKVGLIDKNDISARSLIELYEMENKVSFFREVDPAEFSPQYYNKWKAP